MKNEINFPKNFVEEELDQTIIEKINSMVKELNEAEGIGINSVIMKDGVIVINRDPLKQMSAGKIVVIIPRAYTLTIHYE